MSRFLFQFRLQYVQILLIVTRVIFDRYDELSLKSKTRKNRAGGTQTQYKVEDNTFISNLKTKESLPSQKQKKNSIFTPVKNSFVNSYIKINSLW